MTNKCRWDRLDDVIMGGQSESKLSMGKDGKVVWSGTLRVEGGGFCGVRSKVRLQRYIVSDAAGLNGYWSVTLSLA